MPGDVDSEFYNDLYGVDEVHEDADAAVSTEHTEESKKIAILPNSPHSKSSESHKADKLTRAQPKHVATQRHDGDLTDSTSPLSYSAQIAKQFSAYQQTPSQERRYRSSLPANPMNSQARPTSGMSAISSYESRTDNASSNPSVDRPIRPSEMKDEG
ncbi:hypothetical protein BD410DRAFT_845468 [Rickenella mellea]|uniref:Uncharacterized protein n=1 Tax=Rickenella mellea TaxID=50990 RepID=A0A4Y7PIN7_9AGAM|nr:hypothetical protein BD410DRAFT_845468 [Rickenella mellea]